MNFLDLLARLGERELAKRLGITPKTLRRWEKSGPSAKGAAILAEVVKRHEGSRKAAKTQQENKRFRETVELPDSDLTEEELRPKRSPETAKEALRAKRKHGFRQGAGHYETERYIGNREWITIARQVSGMTSEPIAEMVLNSWQASGRQFNFTNFLFFRYIPFNPVYTGELVRLQGTWHDWFTRTPARGTASSIASSIEAVFDGYLKNGKHIKGASEMAESKIIWLEAIEIVNFDDKPYATRG